MARAEEKGIPVILVYHDTHTSIEKMSEVTRRLKATDQRAINIALQNIEKYCNWGSILKSLQ